MSVRDALRMGALALAIAAFPGCGGSRVDPPGDDDNGGASRSDAEPDSLAAWASRARDLWAGGDSLDGKEADALAREAFRASWIQAADAVESAQDATTTERLPNVGKAGSGPTSNEVIDVLARVGLTADVKVAHGGAVVWQVVISDPLGSSGARAEFLAWPDPRTSGDTPILEDLPARAPSRGHYGPDAVGDLASWTSGESAGLASAWGRPRSRGGLEIALASRKKADSGPWVVTSNRLLQVEADTALFESTAGSNAPTLRVIGAGGRDPMFDSCPNCPHLERVQRYVFRGETWSLSDERVSPTPYAAFVAFLHALREGLPEAALPYASGIEVIEQAKALGLDIRRGPLRAAPGTLATDVTQRYRTGGTEAIEVTLTNTGERWVVSDVRPTRIVLE